MLDKTKLKETDLILTLVDQRGRQVRAVAKGARKPGSRLAARCELFCEVDLLLAKGRNLDIVSQADLVAAPLGAQPSYELLMAASAMAEVACRCTYEDAEDPYLFAITQAALSGLIDLDVPHLDLIVAAYVFKVLSHHGYMPECSCCVACGDEAPGFFSAQSGGLLCASCARDVPGCESLDDHALAWLSCLLPMRFCDLDHARVDAVTAVRMLGLAHAWAATHLECRLRALEFLLGR